VFTFEVFRDQLIALLVKAYDSEAVTREWPEDVDMKPINGLYGPLFHSGNPIFMEQPEQVIVPKSKLSTIAILQLNGITVEELAKAIEAKQAEVREIKSKPLPSLGTYTHGVYLEGRYVAELADSSVRTYLMNPTLDGEVITYQKSLKIIRAESFN
jgi:hypothetical protein